MKTISIITPCYNEEDNVVELYTRVRNVIASLGNYKYEHIFIDNASQDSTVAILKGLAAADPNVKIIVNARNFGHVRSPMHAFWQAQGDAVIGIVADMQDPPEMIADLVRGWEEGYSMVLAIKRSSEENSLMFWARKRYYELEGEAAGRVKDLPGSLQEVLAALEEDHDFLYEGGVFTEDLVRAWIDLKREREVDPVRLRPHPYEFMLYADC